MPTKTTSPSRISRAASATISSPRVKFIGGKFRDFAIFDFVILKSPDHPIAKSPDVVDC
jgi:hypothetical protein